MSAAGGICVRVRVAEEKVCKKFGMARFWQRKAERRHIVERQAADLAAQVERKKADGGVLRAEERRAPPEEGRTLPGIPRTVHLALPVSVEAARTHARARAAPAARPPGTPAARRRP